MPVEGSFGAGQNGDVVQINPFYSERVKENLTVRASRPRQLPPTPVVESGNVVFDGEGVVPNQWDRPTGDRPGKGRGVQTIGVGRGVFLTPPSNWRTMEPESAVPAKGAQTEGVMPPVEEERTRDAGRVKRAAMGESSPGGLQRDLEMEIVDHLRTQNAQLMEEIDRLRKLQSQQGSNSSWSEVGGATTTGAGKFSGLVGTAVDGNGERGGYHTPRSSHKPMRGKQEIKFTPNGTRVPDGTPPDSGKVEPPVPQPPSEKLAVPPFPTSFMSDGSMEKFLDSYDKVESAPKFMKVQHVWEPSKEMSPRAARAFWLEQEVASLKGSLARLTEGNPLSSSEYWSQKFHPPTGPPVVTGFQRTAASGGRDGVCHHDRAGSSSSAQNVCGGNLRGGGGR